MTDLILQIILIVAIAIPILLAITLHEAAHGFAAKKLGDPTAFMLGRVTLNPLKHIDLFGTILLPAIMFYLGGFIFGYAKPVPVNFNNLNNPRYDSVIVAGAGPMTNIILAIISAVILKIIIMLAMPMADDFFAQVVVAIIKGLGYSIHINVLLAVFNMLPLPPLDGGRVAVGLLPPFLGRPLANLEPYGFFIIIAMVFLLPRVSEQLGYQLDPFAEVIFPIVEQIKVWIETSAGLRF